MQEKQIRLQRQGITLGDIYHVLFRQKWKILVLSAVGIVAGVLLPIVKPAPYQSEAKLFIRYVLEAKSLNPNGVDPKMMSPDQRGENIINSEVEILTSLDLAGQVTDAVGPEKILAKVGGGKDRNAAAAIVRGGLTVDVPKKSSVIRVVFAHPDLEIVQPVLREVVDGYFKKHVEIHGAVGLVGEALTQETDQLRARLAQTEQELRKAKNRAGVISLDDTKKAYTGQLAKIREDIFEAEANLAERQATLQVVTNSVPPKSESLTPAIKPLPSAVIGQYKNLCSRLDLLRSKQQQLLTQFTEENILVKGVSTQVTEAEGLKKRLEDQYPQLTEVSLVTVPKPLGTPPIDVQTETARIAALESKIKVLNTQLDKIRKEATGMDEMEGTIVELQRKKELQEGNYRYFSASLEQSRIDEALGAGKVSNISRVQNPSPPFRDQAKTFKMMAGIMVGGVVAGLALAFLIESFFDRSLKRPSEIETKLRLPLFLAIPDLSRNGNRKMIKAGQDINQVLQPYYEALRDRLVTYFEVRNLTHKPKLVAVTGPDKNSGITMIAAGLAACLSETGDGKVLLVDLNQERGAAHPFYRGKPVCSLDEALSSQENAFVQDNLYVAIEGSKSDKLARILPKRVSSLVPKLKLSDYDYVIFDMPPITQTSVTPRLAGFMDMVMLVLKSEKTDCDVAQRAVALLGESKATVAAVLNKTHAYVPARLHRDFMSTA